MLPIPGKKAPHTIVVWCGINEPSGPVAHALHVKFEEAPRAMDSVLAGQARHTVKSLAPIIVLYLPIGQGVQANALLFMPGMPPNLPASHGRHAAELFAPTLPLYEPAGHILQAAIDRAPVVLL